MNDWKERDLKRMGIATSITDLIGQTPLLQLNKTVEESGARILGKCEFLNPGSSVKDRIGYAMIEDAEKRGVLKEGAVIVEPTSGNTGIALALVGAVKGYKVILTMPDSMSLERQKLLRAFGAHIELTPAHLGMIGAIDKAKEIEKKLDNAIILQQFDNPANPAAHRESTAEEIWNDTDGNVDIVVAGVGTGGSISGISEVLKAKNPNLKVVAVEPKDSAVISGKEAGPHMIQGIGAGFIPRNLNRDVVDEVMTISNEASIEMSRRLAKEEGILVGMSAGANVAAALEVGKRNENKGKTIVTILCDYGERYLSTILFE